MNTYTRHEIEHLIKCSITHLIETGINPLQSKIAELEDKNKKLEEEIRNLKSHIVYIKANTMPDSFY